MPELPQTLARDLAAVGLRVRDLVLYTNGHCNLRCAHCYLGNDLLANGPEFDASSIGTAIAGFGSLDRLTLLGGEILRHTQAERIFAGVDTSRIREARVTTNLTIWNEEAIATALRRGFRFSVSLDGATASVHDRLRGKGSFGITIRHLERLLARHADVEITHTVCSWNILEFPKVVEVCRSLGVRFLNLHLVTAQGNAAEHDDMLLTPSQWRELVDTELTPQAHGEPPVLIRYPLRFATHAEYGALRRAGYHHHATGSYYARTGHRVVIYATGDVFVSSEAFGTESMIGRLSGDTFVYNESKYNELMLADSGDEFDVSRLNAGISGDEVYPIALSVSFKKTTIR